MGTGRAIDLERVGGNETLVLTRLLTCRCRWIGRVQPHRSSRKFADYQFTFGNLLTTFRSESALLPKPSSPLKLGGKD